MKRLLLLSLFFVAGFVCVCAQTTISGTVIDKDGNPIPGAKVEVLKSGESTITELDGSFRMETKTAVPKVKIYYVGMQSKLQKVKPDMIIRLSDTHWWNEESQKYSWLIHAEGAFPDKGISNPSLGLMVGYVKNFGLYVKGVYCPNQSTDCDYVNYWTTGKDKRSFYAITAGGIVRLGCALHAYVGAGYAERKVAWELYNGSYAKNTNYSYAGVAADYGLILKIRKFSINGGVIMSLAGGCNFIGNIGIGVCF